MGHGDVKETIVDNNVNNNDVCRSFSFFHLPQSETRKTRRFEYSV